MSETRVIKIQDICNVKPIIKRREVSWNSVYQFVSGLSGEYILNNVDSKKEPDLHNYLSPLFMDSNLSAEEWYLGLKNFEAMDGFLDAIDFQNNTSSFDRLCDRLEIEQSGDTFTVSIDKLAFSYSPRLLKFYRTTDSIYCMVYANYRGKPSFVMTSGSDIDYIESAKPIEIFCTEIQANLSTSRIELVDDERFFELTDNLNKADPEQRKAISADVDRNLLVVAGAGSGKTRSLVGRMCYLHLAKGIPLSRIQMLTYMTKATNPLSNSAYEQLREASLNLGREIPYENVNVSTIDSFIYRLVSMNWMMMGFKKKPQFRLKDEKRRLEVLTGIITKLQIGRNISADILDSQLKDHANGLIVNVPGIDDILREFIDWQISNCEILDFPYMSCIVKRSLESDFRLKEEICKAFDAILIDEFQDINRLQNEIFSLLYNEDIHFTLVGDDDQTIYAWRGSDVNIIRDLQRDKNVNTVYLTINYRNNPHIVNAGNCVLDDIGERSKKGMQITPRQKSGPLIRSCFVKDDFSDLANEIRKLYNPDPAAERICVLCRINKTIDGIAKALETISIPYIKAKKDQDSQVSDGFRILRSLVYIHNNLASKFNYDTLNDIYGNRITNTELRRYLSHQKQLEDDGNNSEMRLSDLLLLSESVDPRYCNVSTFEDLISNFNRQYAKTIENNDAADREVADPCLSSFSDYVSRNEWLYPASNSEQLRSIFNRFEKMYLSTRIDDSQTDEINKIVISTIHSAKGLEFDTVFIMELNEGSFPKIKRIEEEFQERMNEISELKKSKGMLVLLKNQVTSEMLEDAIAECQQNDFPDDIARDLTDMAEEIKEIRVGLSDLQMGAIKTYLDAYDYYVKKTIIVKTEKIRDANLRKRALDDRYYECEDDYLRSDSDSETELNLIRGEIDGALKEISERQRELDGFLDRIPTVTVLHNIVLKARQYRLDEEKLEHEQQLIDKLNKEMRDRIQEEKRSFYVAISRARNLLYLCKSMGRAQSRFLGILDKKDVEPYKLTTAKEDSWSDAIKRFKVVFESESNKREPNLSAIDSETTQLMQSTGDLKLQIEAYSNEFLSNNPPLGTIKGGAREFLDKALYFDYLGQNLGEDFKDEVLLNLQRCGETLLASHVIDDQKPILTDENDAKEVRNAIAGLRSRCAIKRTPSEKTIIDLLTTPDTFGEKLRNFKSLAIQYYVIYSGKWPNLTELFGDNWEYLDLKIDADTFLVASLDLCNIRNEAIHKKTDDMWKNNSVPIAYDCLITMAGAF